jgi:hypothetical protein
LAPSQRSSGSPRAARRARDELQQPGVLHSRSADSPAGVVLFVILRIVAGTTLDLTSHNLWPFEILMVYAVALAVVGALKMARRFIGVGPDESS